MFTRPTRLALACAGIFTSLASPTYAATEELNPVVVSAFRSEQQLSDVLSSISVITRKDIEKTQSKDLVSILQSEPGLEVLRTGAIGSATSIYLRGGNSNQTLILLDGIPFSGESASGSAAAVEMIPVSQIEKIEIFRGNASALYGSGAVGGVINIITKSGGGEPSLGASVTYGSRNTRSADVSYAGEVGQTKFIFSGSKYLTEGFNSINQASFSDVNSSRNGHRNDSFKLGLSNALSDSVTVGLNVLAANSWTSLDGTSSNRDNDYANRQLRSNSIFVKKNMSAQWLSQLTYSESTSKAQTDYNEYWGTIPLISNSNSEDIHQKISWRNNFDYSPVHKFIFGYENEHLIGKSTVSWAGSVDAHRDIDSFYLGHIGTFGDVTTQENIRLDEIRSGESKLTWLAGLGYSVNQAWKITGTKSTSFNSPTSGQLSDVSQGGNPLLKAEKGDSWEIGAQYRDQKNIFKLAYFDTKYTDLIVPGLTPVSPCPFNYCGTYLENASNVKNDGLEVSLRSIQNFGVIKASYTHQNPVNKSNGEMLLNRARNFGSLEYSTGIGLLEWGVKMFASGYRYTPDAYSGARTRTSGYSVYSTYLSYKVDKNLYLKGSIENILDKKYYQVYGFNTAPQTLFVTLQYQSY